MSLFNPLPTRRAVTAGLTASLAAGGAVAAPRRLITLLGDSITAGYGLPQASALPAQLAKALGKAGVVAIIRGAGVSGHTTADGLARLDRVVTADTSLCVIALGGNDLLQGFAPETTRDNLDKMLRRLKARGVPAMLVGIKAPPELGAYARLFDAAYASLAREYGVPFYPDILDGVARDPSLNQPDHIHPNARGVEVIAGKLAPAIRDALKRV